MITLITGGSGSGKSAYAEKLLEEIKGVDEKYYLATMKIYGEDGRKRVERHRKMREGKGFLTIEQPVDIEDALKKMKKRRKAVLLECMSNLVANEMFQDKIYPAGEVTKKILEGVKILEEETKEVIIVTNNVFEDGVIYDEGTMQYLKALGEINCALVAEADWAVEVVVGIPVKLKEEE